MMTERTTQRFAKPQPTLLDRFVALVSPELALRRMAARNAMAVIDHQTARFARIEAAEHNETRGDKWLISRLSPDSQFEQDLETTRDRSREIYQNDAMGGAIDNKVNHVIGTGHTPQARIKETEGVVTAEEAETYNEEIESVYERWEPRADRSGRFSLWMLSRLAERHNEFDGESFTVFSDVGHPDKPIPLALQVIDPVRVETPPQKAGDPLCRMGIQKNATGEIVGYWVRKQHPGDTKDVGLGYDFIPADRMCHVFEPWFAEQSRGLPWMTRALNRAKDAKDFDEATIISAQIAACFAGFVKQSSGGAMGFDAATQAANGVNAAGRRMEDITPGTIKYLDPGQEAPEFAAPNNPGNSFAPFMEWNYRRVSAAINWPYEMVVKNWGGLSFAAGRLVLTDAKKATEVGQKMMREMWFSRIWARLVEEAVIVGEVSIDPVLFLSERHCFTRCLWMPPQWGYAINPKEEIEADVMECEQNLALLSDKLAARGLDLEEFSKRKAREKKIIDDAGITAPARAGSPAAAVMPGKMPDGSPMEPKEYHQPVGAAE